MTSDYDRGAWKALLNFRDWLDRHSECLNLTFRRSEQGKEVTSDGSRAVRFCDVQKKSNANVRKIITAILADFDVFMKYGEDTEIVGCYDTKSGALVTCKILREKDDMT